MTPFERCISNLISRQRLLTHDAPVGVALSGGADSMALLAALTSLGYDCVALHCNFHLRGDESIRDCRAACDVASSLGARCVVVDFDVPARMAATGESVEMACRELRYAWFEEQREALGLQAVAIAHHRDDRVETMLLNTLRGTGLRGLAAMRPRRGCFVRPMLECSRQDVEIYLKDRGITFVTDSSNLSDDYQRNRVRHHVLPALERVRPDAIARAADTASRIDDARSLYEHMLERYRRDYTDTDGTILLARLLENEGAVARTLLYELLSPYGLDIDVVDQLIAAAGESGRRFGPLLLSRGRLIPIAPGPVAEHRIVRPGDGTMIVEEIARDDFHPRRTDPCIYLDAEAFEGNPVWELRPWHRADRFQPFGMKGTRLVSDLLSDAKLSVAEKERVRLLTRDGKIIWVVGMRAAAHYPVTDTTTRIMRVSIVS